MRARMDKSSPADSWPRPAGSLSPLIRIDKALLFIGLQRIRALDSSGHVRKRTPPTGPATACGCGFNTLPSGLKSGALGQSALPDCSSGARHVGRSLEPREPACGELAVRLRFEARGCAPGLLVRGRMVRRSEV